MVEWWNRNNLSDGALERWNVNDGIMEHDGIVRAEN